jgi:hypothetical protein
MPYERSMSNFLLSHREPEVPFENNSWVSLTIFNVRSEDDFTGRRLS